MESLESICEISVERMQEISAYIRDQMDKGLKGEPSDLQMLPSFVDDVCSGRIQMNIMRNRERTRIRHGYRYGWQ